MAATTEAVGAARAVPERPRARVHLPGLDGLRGLAVIAVIVYHLEGSWLPGGFLGVDVFFVVSGFLITTLLLREGERTGRIDLRSFWVRRARRLLPALLLCVVGSVLVASLSERDLLVGIGRQVLGALTFSTNWLEIRAGSDYFDRGSPQLFRSLWSLAVEEQFYLLWPFAVVGLGALTRSWRVRTGIAAGLATLSTILMAAAWEPGSATRAYYGTDTHATGLMIGAALAFAWSAPHRAWTSTVTWQRYRRWVVGGSLGVLTLLVVVLAESSAVTFRGGIALASLATAGVLLGTIDRDGPLRRALEWGPLTAVGRRSYGLYLWHWPVILVVAQDIPASDGTARFLWSRVWAVVVTWACADLSFRLVETPVRRRGFRGCARLLLARLGPLDGRRAKIALAAGLLTAVAVTTVVLTAPDTSSTQRMIEANEAAASGPRQDETVVLRDDFTMPRGREIDAFGDSMMVGAVPALKYYFPGIQIDARSNRHWSDGEAAVERAGDTLRRAVVLSFGTNAGIDEATVTAVLDRIGPDRMVVLVTIHIDEPRARADNTLLRRVAKERANVEVADWDAAVRSRPDQLQPDGIHPSLEGAHLYASTIRGAFARLSEEATGEKVWLAPKPMP